MAPIVVWFLFAFFGAAIPGGELGISLIAGTILCLFPAMVYAQMITAYPRSGGDYVFVSRILSPELGFMANFYLAFYWMTALGLVVSGMVVPDLTATLGAYGGIYKNTTLLVWTTALGNVNLATIVGFVALALVTVPALLNVRKMYRVLIVGMILVYVSLFVSYAVMWTTTPDVFANAFNAFSGVPNLYQTVIDNATKGGLVSNWTIGATFGPCLLYSWYVLGGWQYPAFVAGEVKRPQKTVPLAIITSLIINGILYVVLVEGYYHAFGYAFINAIGFPNVNPSTTPLWIPFFLSILVKDNPILLFLINVGYFIAPPILMLTFFAFGTRCIFAWSFDRIFPTKFSEVNQRLGSPVNATLLASFVFGAFFLILYNYTTLATYYANFVMGYVIANMIIMVAGIVFPWRRKQTFESAPAFTKMKVMGFPLLTIFGIIAFVYLAYVLYASLTNPAIGGPISYASIGFMLGVLAFAPILYWISVLYHRRKGIDITLAFKQIPPE
jgi:amino acid transporter